MKLPTHVALIAYVASIIGGLTGQIAKGAAFALGVWLMLRLLEVIA